MSTPLPELLSDLYDMLDEDPRNIFVRERLIEAWIAEGDRGKASTPCGRKKLTQLGIASELASDLLLIDSGNTVALQCLQQSGTRHTVPSRPLRPTNIPSRSRDGYVGPDISTPSGRVAAEKHLIEGYAALKKGAEVLAFEMGAIPAETWQQLDEDADETIGSLRLIIDGQVTAAVGQAQLRAVRQTARDVEEAPLRAKEIIFEDFEDLVQWALSQSPPLGTDDIRERLVKRKVLLEAVMLPSMETHTSAAMAHVEREFLNRQYANSETMLGDRIQDIPRENFFVSEDNYAWDMSELAQALESNEGVMRNPLNRQMFTESDIGKILGHPQGQRLKPLRLAQSQLKQGVRSTTIDRVAELGSTMLADQSIDMAPSRQAMDEFLAYVATLPAEEQNTITSLRIEARDSFNGQAFDYTIRQAIQDAKANVTCFHKVRCCPEY
jgi:hypothetical protein